MQSLKSIRLAEVDNFFKQSFEQKKNWFHWRTDFADQATGQGMCHSHMIRVPWAMYEQCTLARVQEMAHTLSRVWAVHPGQGTRTGTYPEQCILARVQEMVHTLSRVWTVHPGQGMRYGTFPDMGVLLFPGQDDFLLLFIIFWLIILCTLTHKFTLPRVPCHILHTRPRVPHIPCPVFYAYPALCSIYMYAYPTLGSMHTLLMVPPKHTFPTVCPK